MSIQLYGRWNPRITQAIHNWENRFRIEGATAGSGTYPPTIGFDVVADGTSWSLIAEYRESDADSWKPSEMMIDRGVERVDIAAVIGAEDPLPSRDFEDIQWEDTSAARCWRSLTGRSGRSGLSGLHRNHGSGSIPPS